MIYAEETKHGLQKAQLQAQSWKQMLDTSLLSLTLIFIDRYLLSVQWEGVTAPSVNKPVFTKLSSSMYWNGVCILWNASPRCPGPMSLSALNFSQTIHCHTVSSYPISRRPRRTFLLWSGGAPQGVSILLCAHQWRLNAIRVNDQTDSLYISSYLSYILKRNKDICSVCILKINHPCK